MCGVALIECTPLSSVDSYSSKVSSKLEDNSNKSTYLKRAGELASPLLASNGNSNGKPIPPFISSLPPMAAASSGLLSQPNAAPVASTVNSVLSDVAILPDQQLAQDIDDTFASGSLAGTDFGPDIMRYTRKDSEATSASTTTAATASSPSTEAPSSAPSTATTSTVASSGRFKKNGTIFSRNEQNITTLKLKNYNRGMDKEELKLPPRSPDPGRRLVETLLLTSVENSTDAAELTLEHVTDVELEETLGNTTEAAGNRENSFGDSATFPVHTGDALQSSDSSENISSFSTSSSNNNHSSNSSSTSSSDRDIPDSHSDSVKAGTLSTSDRRIGKILSSDFRDFVSNGNNPNASSYISRAIAFSTQNLQEGIDDQDHPLEDDDYRRSSRTQQRLNVGAISGICLASLGLLSGISAAVFILYRRYLYINKPQTLSEPDSSGYIDDSTIRDNSDEMYSLDNDSFLNSLEAMTIQNYWTDNVKHTKL